MLNYEDWLIFGGRLVWLLEKRHFFCTSVMSSLFPATEIYTWFAPIHPLHMSPNDLLPPSPAALSSRHDCGPPGRACVCLCVCKYACVSRSRTTARSHWKERVMVRPEVSVDDVWPGSCWSCSMLLFLCDPSDPALALMSNTHTHTFAHLHIVRHMTPHTHIHMQGCAGIYVNLIIC